MKIDRVTKGPKAYGSVQCGPGLDDHIELNSNFVYGAWSDVSMLLLSLTWRRAVNHSCEPNIVLNLSSRDLVHWHVRAMKPVSRGEEVCHE
jgi:hypothetical protein